MLNSSPEALRFTDYRTVIKARFTAHYKSPSETISAEKTVHRETRLFPGTGIWLDVIYRGVIDERGDVVMIWNRFTGQK